MQESRTVPDRYLYGRIAGRGRGKTGGESLRSFSCVLEVDWQEMSRENRVHHGANTETREEEKMNDREKRKILSNLGVGRSEIDAYINPKTRHLLPHGNELDAFLEKYENMAVEVRQKHDESQVRIKEYKKFRR